MFRNRHTKRKCSVQHSPLLDMNRLAQPFWLYISAMEKIPVHESLHSIVHRCLVPESEMVGLAVSSTAGAVDLLPLDAMEDCDRCFPSYFQNAVIHPPSLPFPSLPFQDDEIRQ
ncbi:hypothetical protein B296_00056740 [Ensete ventricosum]|uniref:Uncharacterized protein n=1 Tax=Ensete ventricosum TaxID=4639 RepID=A0A426WYN7_ENSVE|nr:hypothetical protein B296_00056740 [Ensete ventricosum]